MEIQHFSHKHTLTFKKNQQKEVGQEVSCFLCEEPVSGPNYNCKQCNFFLHKTCAELPREIEHTFHRRHPLILHENKPSGSNDLSCICHSCGNICGSFVYRCSLCNFNLHIKCAFIPCAMNPMEKRHNFVLLLESKIPYFCDACGGDGSYDSWAYFCTMCQLLVHSDCHWMLPAYPTMEITRHDHPLTYTFFLQENESGKQHCSICVDEILPEHGCYFCSECSYLSHFGCALESMICESTPLHGEEDEFEALVPQKDFIDEPMDSITHGIDEIDLEENKIDMEVEHLNNERKFNFSDEVRDDDEHCDRCKLSISASFSNCHLKHFGHEHPLLFIEEPNNFGEQVSTCFGCEKPVLGPSYSCSQCNFLLHKTCAELPSKIKHPFHRKHPLILVTKFPFVGSHYYNPYCYCCGENCPRFVYFCSYYDHFCLDIKCATQPCVIDPQANQHQFIHWMRSIPFTCNTCGKDEKEQTPYFCTLCQVKVHKSCISLPHTVKITQHDHPLTRNYFFHENVSAGAMNCGICHSEVNTEYGSYHCPGCSFIAHASCALVNDHK